MKMAQTDPLRFALERIVDLAPGSQGGYQKFRTAQQLAQSALDHPHGDMYAVIDGQRHLMTMCYDRASYRHKEGCLAYLPNEPAGDRNQACQCGAAERATKVYYVEIPGVRSGS
jgi:hypothetical protein